MKRDGRMLRGVCVCVCVFTAAGDPSTYFITQLFQSRFHAECCFV